MPQSDFGRTKVFEDFLGFNGDEVWNAGTFNLGLLSVTSVNEGSVAPTLDEPGGIVAITTDTGDDDNVALFVGTFQPSLGGAVMEARFKFSNLDCAIFAGFSETLALDTPVMPAEFATATMTYNGTGGMIGAQYDVDGTTDDFRAVFGDGGAVATGADTAGTRALQTMAADEWYIVRVEAYANGGGAVYVGHNNGLDGDLKLVKEVRTAALTNTDQLHAVLMLENRSANARVLEVDYFYAEGGRDWAV